MDEGRRLTASNERKPAEAELGREIWQESGGEIGAIDRCWSEARWSPGADFEIESIHLAWRSREQDKDTVLCRVEYSCRTGCTTLSKHLHRRNEVSRYAGCRNFEKESSIDN